MIKLEHVSKVYRQGNNELNVLKNINFEIQENEFVSIMGPSGSGKSTLMNIIGCLDKPTTGNYWLRNINLLNKKDSQRAQVRNQNIGFVFQNFHLLPRLSAVDNVELPLVYAGIKKKERRERSVEALMKVGLGERMKHLPNQLSGGQKQRVAIARAIVHQPSFILADEPTGSLDSKSSEDIMSIFLDLNKMGTTVVIVTHENEVAAHTSRRITIRDGEIVQDQRVEYECS